MKKLREMLNALFHPGVPALLALTALSAAGLSLVFYGKVLPENDPVSCSIYFLSAYTLVTLVIAAGHSPLVRLIQRILHRNPLSRRFLTDRAFRTWVTLLLSLALNLLFAFFKLVVGLLYDSFWWKAEAFYYVVLSALRFLLLRSLDPGEEGKNLIAEFRQYRRVGLLLIGLNLTLTGIIVQMIWQDRNHLYPGYIIYVFAGYTFFAVISSIWNLILYRKYESPVLSAVKVISVVAALVSVLSLETGMIAQFGTGQKEFRHLMLSASGTVVCVTVLILSIWMVVRASRQLQRLEQG